MLVEARHYHFHANVYIFTGKAVTYIFQHDAYFSLGMQAIMRRNFIINMNAAWYGNNEMFTSCTSLIYIIVDARKMSLMTYFHCQKQTFEAFAIFITI